MDPVKDTELVAPPTYNALLHDLAMVRPHCAMLYFRDYNHIQNISLTKFSCAPFGQKQDCLLLRVTLAGI